MTRLITANPSQTRYCSTVTQSVTIHRTPDIVWEEIGDFAGLARWVRDVQKTGLLSKTKRGIGAAREISFSDGSHVIEYAVGWAEKSYISYIATSGLPLEGYHATISILQKGGASEVSWTSFLISDSQDRKKFDEFLGFIESFYSDSLKNLKARLENQAY
ncbi:MAG: SRPBCC family protein [Candidatus Nitrosotenuis sp.]